MSAPSIITVQGEEFDEGLVSAVPPSTIPPGAAAFIQNVDFSRLHGRIVKRRGIQINQAELVVGGVSKVSGLFHYVKTSGTKKLMAAAGNDVYEVAGGVWTSRYTGVMAGANCNFVTFKDLLLMVAPTEATKKWDGVVAAFVTLLGTPPSNGKFIAVFQNRVWIANTSAGKSRVHYSADGNPEDWITAGQAGFMDVNADDGDEITGMVATSQVLIIFKNRSVHVIGGNKPDNFYNRPVIQGRGCVAPRSIVSMGPFVIYLSDYGVHSFSTDTDGFLSDAVRFDIENLSTTVKQGCVGGKSRDTYILSYDSDADGKNDKSFVLNLRPNGAWTQYTNTKANVYANLDDGTLLSGGSEKIIVRQHDSGDDDEGNAIDMIWRSGQLPFDDFTGLKTLLETFVQAKPIANKNLTVRFRIDGVLVDEFTQSLTPRQTAQLGGGLVDEDILVFGKDGNEAIHGRFVEIEFRNNELAAPVEIIRFDLKADVKPRQQAA